MERHRKIVPSPPKRKGSGYFPRIRVSFLLEEAVFQKAPGSRETLFPCPNIPDQEIHAEAPEDLSHEGASGKAKMRHEGISRRKDVPVFVPDPHGCEGRPVFLKPVSLFPVPGKTFAEEKKVVEKFLPLVEKDGGK